MTNRLSLFAGPQLAAGLRQVTAGSGLLADLYARLLHEAECTAEHDNSTELPAGAVLQGKARWYAELQEAHRVGAVLARLALCHVVSDRSDLASACISQMREAADRPVDPGSPMQDLVIAALARGLCLAYDLLIDDGYLGSYDEHAGLVARVEQRLLEMADWLEYYLTKGGNGARRNHDVIVSCTLGLIALLLNQHQTSGPWIRLACKCLDELLYTDDRYLGQDGDWYEGSLRYHLYILPWLQLFAEACRNLGLRDYFANPKTRGLFEAIGQFVTPDGHNVAFNDTSHSEIVWLGLGPMLVGAAEYGQAAAYHSLCQIVATLPETPLVPAEAFLALRRSSLPTITSDPGRTVAWFRRTGTVVARGDWTRQAAMFALECGPHSSHHHLSHSTFEYYYAGQPVILDTGCGHYLDRARWILPEMHNIVVVDGGYRPRYSHPLYGDQAFDFVPAFHGQILDVQQSDVLVFVQADYRAQTRVGTAIRNAWFVDPGYLMLEDRLEADDGLEHEFVAYMHAHGTLERDGTDTATITTPAGMQVHLQVFSPSQAEWFVGRRLLAGDEMPAIKSGGELSLAPRRSTQLDYLRIRHVGHMARFQVALLPLGAGGVRLQRNERLSGGHLVRVSVHERVVDLWLLRDGGGTGQAGALRTDGSVAYVRLADGRPVAWFILNGQFLAYEDVTLVNSPLLTTFLGQART